MEDIVIYGAGGLAAEIAQLIEDINAVAPRWNLLGYIDDNECMGGRVIHGYKVLGSNSILGGMEDTVNVVIGVGDPGIKEKLFNGISKYSVKFPALIHPSAIISRGAVIGEGSVVGMQCIVSVNAVIGRQVLLNTKTFVAHDSSIGDFCSCYVNAIINGRVAVGKGCLLGANCVIMEKKTIGEGAKVSMGSVVTFDVENRHVVMSKPSKSMFFGE